MRLDLDTENVESLFTKCSPKTPTSKSFPASCKSSKSEEKKSKLSKLNSPSNNRQKCDSSSLNTNEKIKKESSRGSSAAREENLIPSADPPPSSNTEAGNMEGSWSYEGQGRNRVAATGRSDSYEPRRIEKAGGLEIISKSRSARRKRSRKPVPVSPGPLSPTNSHNPESSGHLLDEPSPAILLDAGGHLLDSPVHLLDTAALKGPLDPAVQTHHHPDPRKQRGSNKSGHAPDIEWREHEQVGLKETCFPSTLGPVVSSGQDTVLFDDIGCEGGEPDVAYDLLGHLLPPPSCSASRKLVTVDELLRHTPEATQLEFENTNIAEAMPQEQQFLHEQLSEQQLLQQQQFYQQLSQQQPLFQQQQKLLQSKYQESQQHQLLEEQQQQHQRHIELAYRHYRQEDPGTYLPPGRVYHPAPLPTSPPPLETSPALQGGVSPLLTGASPSSVPCSPANISRSGLEGEGGILTPSLGVSPSLASGSLDNLYLGEEAAGGPSEPTPNIGTLTLTQYTESPRRYGPRGEEGGKVRPGDGNGDESEDHPPPPSSTGLNTGGSVSCQLASPGAPTPRTRGSRKLPGFPQRIQTNPPSSSNTQDSPEDSDSEKMTSALQPADQSGDRISQLHQSGDRIIQANQAGERMIHQSERMNPLHQSGGRMNPLHQQENFLQQSDYSYEASETRRVLREFFKQEDPLPAARDMYSPAVVQMNATSANSGANRNQKSEFDGQQRHEEQSTLQQSAEGVLEDDLSYSLSRRTVNSLVGQKLALDDDDNILHSVTGTTRRGGEGNQDLLDLSLPTDSNRLEQLTTPSATAATVAATTSSMETQTREPQQQQRSVASRLDPDNSLPSPPAKHHQYQQQQQLHHIQHNQQPHHHQYREPQQQHKQSRDDGDPYYTVRPEVRSSTEVPRSSAEMTLSRDTEILKMGAESRNFTLSPETTDCDSADLESELSLPSAGEGSFHSSGPRIHTSMPILEDGLSSGHASDLEEEGCSAPSSNQPSALTLLKLQSAHTCVVRDGTSIYSWDNKSSRESKTSSTREQNLKNYMKSGEAPASYSDKSIINDLQLLDNLEDKENRLSSSTDLRTQTEVKQPTYISIRDINTQFSGIPPPATTVENTAPPPVNASVAGVNSNGGPPGLNKLNNGGVKTGGSPIAAGSRDPAVSCSISGSYVNGRVSTGNSDTQNGKQARHRDNSTRMSPGRVSQVLEIPSSRVSQALDYSTKVAGSVEALIGKPSPLSSPGLRASPPSPAPSGNPSLPNQGGAAFNSSPPSTTAPPPYAAQSLPSAFAAASPPSSFGATPPFSESTAAPPTSVQPGGSSPPRAAVQAAIKDIRKAIQSTKTLESPAGCPPPPPDPWVPRPSADSPSPAPTPPPSHLRDETESEGEEDDEDEEEEDEADQEEEEEEVEERVPTPEIMKREEEELDTDQETDRLLGQQYTEADPSYYNKKDSVRRKSQKANEGPVTDPKVLIEGVLFRARYLGSTQLVCEGQPTKATRMMQAEEAVSRIKAPTGESQPSTEVDLFISTEKIMVLNTDLKEIMMDHGLRTISYIADIGELVVIMARRRLLPQDGEEPQLIGSTPKMICHVFESEEAQFIAQSIGQAFQVAYMEFLKANGIEDNSFVKEMDYQEVLNSQEIFGDELAMFAKKELQKEVVVPKAKGEILGVVIVESGWGSMLPTIVIANLCPTGPAARCGHLNIGDQVIAINGVSLVGLPLSTCQQYIKNTKNKTAVKLTAVSCPPVVEVKIKRPDTKYQLGFSVQNGVICSLLRGGIAERGGVRVGHRIIEINGQSVVAVPHERIVNLLATSVGEIAMKTMPTSMYRLLTGQETPVYI